MKIFDNLQIGVQIIDEEMRYVYLNKSLLHDMKLSLSDHVGRKMEDVYPGFEDTKVYQLIKECLLTSNIQHIKNEFISEDGSITYWELEMERIPEGVLIFSKNITNKEEGIKILLESNERLKREILSRTELLKKAHQKIEDKKQKFDKVFFYLPDPCFVLDREQNKIIDCNPAMEKIMMASRDQIIDLDLLDISPEFQKHVNKLSSDYAKDLINALDNQESIRFVWEHKSLIDEKIIVDVSAAKIFEANREYLICVWKDITLLKQQEIEIAKQTKIAEHNAKLASVGILAAAVGHEINNPLSIIKGYLSIIKANQNEEFFSNKLNSIIEKIDKASDRIAKIVIGLRNFSRHDDRESQLFSPLEVIQETYDMLFQIYKKEEVFLNFNVNLVHENPLVKGSRGQFQQILINLLSNAKDAMDEITTIKNISINYFEVNEHVRIEVIDSGKGIAEENIDKVFAPFFTTKEVNKGTGIGLSLVYDQVNKMNGTISFKTKLNSGTTFIIQFPIFSNESLGFNAPCNQIDCPQNEKKMKSASILLVDDEENILEILKNQLEDIGNVVDCAQNGEVALNLFNKNPEKYDLVITDLKMPKMGGKELFDKITSQKMISCPKFIFMTGGVENSFESTLEKFEFIYKPIDENKLMELIEKKLH